MADFDKLKTTLAYARLGLVSLTAAVAPITSTAQVLCGTDLFEGEPDAASLMNETVEFLNILANSGVVAFEGADGRVSVDAARRALQDGVGSASLLACIVNSDSIEFAGGPQNQVIGCGVGGQPSLVQPAVARANIAPSTGQLFCTAEVATVSQYIGSES
ncbi:MAG: hypothetical protein QNJ03_06200 [Dinoroseobacter sp.]|nr:hypothetical protein [Dinoroseobacter sp.]